MLITPPPSQTERRDQARRATDRAVDDLQKTFSTPHCHSCLERMSDGVLLLDNKTQVIFTTPQMDQILKRYELPLALSPKFTLHNPRDACRFAAFVNGKIRQAGPLNLLLDDENGRDLLLLNCFLLPKPADPNIQAARYMITLRDPNHYPSRQWQLFTQQFNLTPAEARLCRAFADGFTLNDYCEKWTVAASSTASSKRPPRTDSANC